MSERRAVDAHEDHAEVVGDIFHQGGIAVAGRGDEEQESHAVAAAGVACRADLLGEVVADDGQVNLVD
ncbi:MAG: hypothetical protein LBL48_04620 [Azoarcus sp.]|jgi:hypothetical protein|nr:hypothetical protein [Azoarcus sp.]